MRLRNLYMRQSPVRQHDVFNIESDDNDAR